MSPCNMAKRYCGALRRRRIRAETAQTNARLLAREIPYLSKAPHPSGGRRREPGLLCDDSRLVSCIRQGELLV